MMPQRHRQSPALPDRELCLSSIASITTEALPAADDATRTVADVTVKSARVANGCAPAGYPERQRLTDGLFAAQAVAHPQVGHPRLPDEGEAVPR